MMSYSHWGMFSSPLLMLAMAEAMKPKGPALDHAPTARLFGFFKDRDDRILYGVEGHAGTSPFS